MVQAPLKAEVLVTFRNLENRPMSVLLTSRIELRTRSRRIKVLVENDVGTRKKYPQFLHDSDDKPICHLGTALNAFGHQGCCDSDKTYPGANEHPQSNVKSFSRMVIGIYRTAECLEATDGV